MRNKIQVNLEIENNSVVITRRGYNWGCGFSFNLDEITLKQITFLLWEKIKCGLKL